MSEAVENEKQHGLIWKELKSLRSAVFGNGTKGHEQRIIDLEARTKPENCIGSKELEKYKQEIDDKKNFSMQTVLLWIAVIGIIVQIITSLYIE